MQACREGKHAPLQKSVVFQWVLSKLTAITGGVEQRVTEMAVLGAHWRQAIKAQAVSPKGEMNHKRLNITELKRHVISLL